MLLMTQPSCAADILPVLMQVLNLWYRMSSSLSACKEVRVNIPWASLAVRTFDAAVDDIDRGKIQVRWFRRKSNNRSWGTQPASKYAEIFTNRRQSRPWLATVDISTIIALPVVLTPRSFKYPGEPVLSRDCMALVRAHMEKLARSGEL
eukprot:84564-Pleurochrysis_carterae.AAC.1